MVDTAEFYDYLINSVIVTIGTLAISLSIGALAGYGLARFRHVVSVYILVIALASARCRAWRWCCLSITWASFPDCTIRIFC